MKVGVITTKQNVNFEADVVKYIGNDPESFGRNMFRVLREFDEEGIRVIISEGLEGIGLGLAVMNRLRKAASEIVGV